MDDPRQNLSEKQREVLEQVRYVGKWDFDMKLSH